MHNRAPHNLSSGRRGAAGEKLVLGGREWLLMEASGIRCFDAWAPRGYADRRPTPTARTHFLAVGLVQKVVVDVEPGRAIVSVKALRGAIVGDDEVGRDLTHRGREARRPIGDLRHKGLPVPRVDGPVVASLAARVEQKVAVRVVSAAKAVVEVDGSSRLVESHVRVEASLR
eukprot:3645295-Prymnesium_polylepis.1